MAKFTIAYQRVEDEDEDPQPPEVAQFLKKINGDYQRQLLPRFVGSVLGIGCAVHGNSLKELRENARQKLPSVRRIHRSRGLPDPIEYGEATGRTVVDGNIRYTQIDLQLKG